MNLTREQLDKINLDAYRKHVRALSDALAAILKGDVYDYGDGETRITVSTEAVREAANSSDI